LKGELVMSDIIYSDQNSDTIFSLESLRTKYIPLIPNHQYDSSLDVYGLELFIRENDKTNQKGLSVNNLSELFDKIFFDSIDIKDSYLIFKNDSIQNKIYINNSYVKDIKKVGDGANFKVENLNAIVDNFIINNFSSSINLDKEKFSLKNIYLNNQENFLEGDMVINFDKDFKIKNISNSSLDFNFNPNLFEPLKKNIELNGNISGKIQFSGTKEDLKVNKLFLSHELFELNSEINIKNILSDDFEIDTFINDLDINEAYLNSNYKFNERFNLPLFQGSLNIKNKNLTFIFNELNESEKNEIKLEGNIKLDSKFSYQLKIDSSFTENDKLLEILDLNYLNLETSISGSNKLTSINSNINLVKDENEFKFITNSKIVNDNLNGQIELFSKNVNIESYVSGNMLNKLFVIDSKIDVIGNNNSEDYEINTNSKLDLDLSDSKNIISLLKLEKLFYKSSENEFLFENLYEINNILKTNIISNCSNYDFKIFLKDGSLQFNSFLGENLKINGYYKNSNNLNLDIQISDLIVNNFHEINKNPISGIINSVINVNRSPENRTFMMTSNFSNLQIKNYDLGNMNINIFGNTDYRSYAVNLDLVKQDSTILKGEGSIIATNDKPNIDIDFVINNLDISFIEKIGSNTMSNISSNISGKINLWGQSDNIQHNGKLFLNDSKFTIPYLNIDYLLSNNSEVELYNQNFEFNNVNLDTKSNSSPTLLVGKINHQDYKNWNLDLNFQSDRLYILNKEYNENDSFYGEAYLGGDIKIYGPTNQVSININGETQSGTNITIPQTNNYSFDDFSFITFSNLNSNSKEITNLNYMSSQSDKSLDLNINLEINDNAEVEITVDQETGSYISGKGNGDLFMEIDSDGKFNIFGDFIATEGIYNFRNLALIDKKFKLKKGGTIVWDGDPLLAQMNIQASYEVPGGANPALLLDNPNFNKKIPTDVEIKLTGELTKPDSPEFEIFFPNTSSTVISEINYKLNDPEIRQLQAISLLTQGIFINEVSVSIEGVTNNIYEKVSEVFSDILGGSQGPLEVGLNYLQGDKSEILDIKTEDRFGVTLSTKISDKILFNGKIGVPIGGIEETLIIGDVQIDFILNQDGTLRAKVFNKENEFRYIGDELGYTQGIGLSYQVDFQTFRSLISKIINNNNN
tara:strand:+ start:2763 stop:6209 length:3447 start_codon:yes stop_codon:yes gene_type:complete